MNEVTAIDYLCPAAFFAVVWCLGYWTALRSFKKSDLLRKRFVSGAVRVGMIMAAIPAGIALIMGVCLLAAGEWIGVQAVIFISLVLLYALSIRWCAMNSCLYSVGKQAPDLPAEEMEWLRREVEQGRVFHRVLNRFRSIPYEEIMRRLEKHEEVAQQPAERYSK